MIRKQRGFTLFEIVIAVGCIALIALPIAGVVGGWMVGKDSPKQRLETQQSASELIQQLNRDFRAASEIHDPTDKSLTLKVEGKYVRYQISNTLSRQEASSLAGPFVEKASYIVSGGVFIFNDAQGKTTTDVSKISSILLSGLKIQGSEYSVNVPALAVSQRFGVEATSTAANCVIYSGSAIDDLVVSDTNHMDVFGTIHSNADVDLSNTNKVNDNDKEIPELYVCEAVGTITGGKDTRLECKPGVSSLAMPVFLPKPDEVFPYKEDTNNISLDDDHNTPETIQGSLYTTHGNIKIDCKHLTINGNVTAEYGNITILGHDVTINGRVYAPHGKVIVDSQNHTAVRQIVANLVVLDGTQLEFGPLP